MKFLAYLKCLIFQVCKFISGFNIGCFFCCLLCFDWKRQFKEKLNSIKTFEACLYTALSGISIYVMILSVSMTQFGATGLMCV